MRNLEAELLAEVEKRELEKLRELRDQVLLLGKVLGKSNRYEPLTPDEKRMIIAAFDDEGAGPFATVEPRWVWGLVKLAREAKP